MGRVRAREVRVGVEVHHGPAAGQRRGAAEGVVDVFERVVLTFDDYHAERTPAAVAEDHGGVK